MEFKATIAVIFMLGILLALAQMIQLQKRRMTELNQFLTYLAPLMARLEQTMELLGATLPQATEAMHALADAMQRFGITFEETTRDEIGNNQNGKRQGSIRMTVVGLEDK